MPPEISVIIPVFNRPEMLERAVESVLAQSYKDFELIVVNDGSTVSLERVKRRVKAAGHKFMRTEPRGPAAARNVGAAAARGRWLAFLDSDDLWEENKLKSQIEFHRRHPEFKISQCKEMWIRDGKRINQKKHHKMPEGEAFFQSLKLCCISPSSVMMESALFRGTGGFDERFRVCEDYDLWLRVTAFCKVGLVPERLVVKYGGHGDQLSRSEEAIDRYRVFSILKLLLECTLPSDKTKAALKELVRKAGILLKGAQKRSFPQAALYEEIQGAAETLLGSGKLSKVKFKNLLYSCYIKLERRL